MATLLQSVCKHLGPFWQVCGLLQLVGYPSQEYFADIEMPPMPRKGWDNQTKARLLHPLNKVPRGISAATEGVSILYYREKTCGSCWDKVHLSKYKTKAINAALSLITWFFFRVFLPLKQKYWCNTDMWSVRRVSILLPAGRDQHTKLRKFATILNFVSMSVH